MRQTFNILNTKAFYRKIVLSFIRISLGFNVNDQLEECHMACTSYNLSLFEHLKAIQWHFELQEMSALRHEQRFVAQFLAQAHLMYPCPWPTERTFTASLTLKITWSPVDKPVLLFYLDIGTFNAVTRKHTTKDTKSHSNSSHQVFAAMAEGECVVFVSGHILLAFSPLFPLI